MLYNNTILLTVSGLSSDFYWNMSDMNHTQQEGFHKGVTGHDRHFLDAFLSTHIHSNYGSLYH